MATIKRTNKVISVENLNEKTIRKMAALGGHEIHCEKIDWSRFVVTDRIIGRHSNGMTMQNPSTQDIVNGFIPEPDGISIKIKNFDTDIVVWNTGQVQGYYNSSSRNAQYAANYLGWVNLMLENGFYEIERKLDSWSSEAESL